MNGRTLSTPPRTNRGQCRKCPALPGDQIANGYRSRRSPTVIAGRRRMSKRIQYTVYSIQYTVYCILYTVHCIYDIIYSVQCTVYSTQYTIHYTPYTFTGHLYSTLCTGHLQRTTSTGHFYTIHIYRTLLQTQDMSTHDIEIISSTHIFKGQSGNAEQILTCDIEQGLPCRT
jgi:hypothetical protein